MGVVVGGTDRPGGVPPPDSRRVRAPGMLALVAVATAAATFALLPASPPAPRSPTPVREPDSGRWIPLARSTVDPFDARRLGDRYVFVTSGGLASIEVDGVTTITDLDGRPQQVTSDGDTAVVHGIGPGGVPTIWTSDDGVEWTPTALPWRGAILAVAIRPDGPVVLGLDRGREVVARPSAFGGWDVTPTDAPDTGLWSTGSGIVGRGTLDDGSVGYLHTVDGLRWEPIGAHLSLHWGDVATLHDDRGTTLMRVAESGLEIRPPETPVSSLWVVDERIWVQTPSGAWWSRDGLRWTALPIDARRGVVQGAPILLPFEDRALLSVGGARGMARQIFVWILGG